MGQLSWYALDFPTDVLWHDPYLLKLTWPKPTNTNWFALEPVLTKLPWHEPVVFEFTWRAPILVELGARKDLKRATRSLEDTLAGIPAHEIEAALVGEATRAIKVGDDLMLGLCLAELRDPPSWLIAQIAQLLLDLHPLGRRLESRPLNRKDPDETPIREYLRGLELERLSPFLKKAAEKMDVPLRTAQRAQSRLRQWRRDWADLRSKLPK